MVGVAHSKGCETCRKRRIKCDMEKPSCGNCRKSKRECGGYHRDRKFVSVEPGDKLQTGPSPRASPSPSSTHSPMSSPIVWQHETPQSLIEPRSSASRKNSRSPGPRSPLMTVRGSSTDLAQLFHSYLSCHDPPLQEQPALGVTSRWLLMIPSVLGQDAGLDHAASSIALQCLGRRRQRPDFMERSRAEYGQALRSLQRSLGSETTRASSHSLCTALLLCHYEMSTENGDAIWTQHASGMRKLVELRGPSGFDSDFDRALLCAASGPLSTQALLTGETCLFTDPQWQHVLDGALEDSTDFASNTQYLERLEHELLVVCGVTSRLVGEAPLRQAQITSRGGLVSEVHDNLAAWRAWRSKLGMSRISRERLSQSSAPGEVSGIVNDYHSPDMMMLVMKWILSTLMLYRVLDDLGEPQPDGYVQDRLQLMDGINRSVDYAAWSGAMGQGMLGRLRAYVEEPVASRLAARLNQVQGPSTGQSPMGAATGEFHTIQTSCWKSGCHGLEAGVSFALSPPAFATSPLTLDLGQDDWIEALLREPWLEQYKRLGDAAWFDVYPSAGGYLADTWDSGGWM